MSDIKIAINVGDKRRYVKADGAENLLEVLRRNGYRIPADCGGASKCGKCEIEISRGDGVFKKVLACKTLADGAELFAALFVLSAVGAVVRSAFVPAIGRVFPARALIFPAPAARQTVDVQPQTSAHADRHERGHYRRGEQFGKEVVPRP